MSNGTPCHEQLAKMRERVETERARYAHMALKVAALEARVSAAERLVDQAQRALGVIAATFCEKRFARGAPCGNDDDFCAPCYAETEREDLRGARLSQGEPK